MKKILIVVLAAFFCLAFALPAMAKVTAYGRITTDIYWFDQDEEVITGPYTSTMTRAGNGFTEVTISPALSWNRFGLKFSSEDNSVRGLIELRGGDYSTAGVGGNFNVHFNYGWIDWQINPNFYLRIGRQTQAFSIHYPQTILGFDNGHTLGIGFGNIHGGSSRDAIRAYIKLSDMARLELQILDPDTDNAEIIRAVPFPADPTGTVREENVLPRFDVAVPLNFGAFSLEPSLTWLRQEYDQVAGGSDSDVDVWGVSLWAKAAFGVISVEGEITYGENLADGNIGWIGGQPYVGFAAAAQGFMDAGGCWHVADTEILAFWAQVGFKFGPATLYGIYGMMNGENDNIPGGAFDTDITRSMYGATLPISVVKGFTIRPEVMIYDYDDGAKLLGVDVDMGSETLVGVEFMLVF